MSKLVPVILCGGSGTRLWPLSRKKTPKQFLKLMDEFTLLQRTAMRTLHVADIPDVNIVTVTLESLRGETIRQLQEISPGLTRHVLSEPQARNTAAAVALAINYVRRTFGEDALLWLLPADHYIGDEEQLKAALHRAVTTAHDGYMVTFGIEPSRPEIGYGYIRKADSLNGSGAYAVEKFIEKPPRDRAIEFLATGEYLWSSGMHLFRADIALDHFRQHAPDTFSAIEQAMEETASACLPSPLIYSQIREEPFEMAVIEKASKVAVVPCDPLWSDIGSWESLWEIRNKDEDGNALDGNVACHGTRNSMILSQDRLVTCVGLNDVIIIETGDSILVADKKSNHSLKALVESLRVKERQETISSATEHHYWGRLKTLARTPWMTLHEVVIKPGQIKGRTDYDSVTGNWMVVTGHGIFNIDGTQTPVAPGKSLTIADGASFSITNPGAEELRLYEVLYVQTGDEKLAYPDFPLGTSTGKERRLVA